jgi:hypothetical protein
VILRCCNSDEDTFGAGLEDTVFLGNSVLSSACIGGVDGMDEGISDESTMFLDEEEGTGDPGDVAAVRSDDAADVDDSASLGGATGVVDSASFGGDISFEIADFTVPGCRMKIFSQSALRWHVFVKALQSLLAHCIWIKQCLYEFDFSDQTGIPAD